MYIEVTMKSSSLLIFHRVSDLIYLILGPLVAACGVSLFYTPAKIVAGGSTGLATIIYYLTGFDQGIAMMFINVPLILIGMKVFGFKYGVRTLIGSTLLSFWVSVLNRITDYHGVLELGESTNILLSAIFGGILLGAGIGITMRSGCNTGGTDIVAQVLHHFTPISVGSVQFAFNFVVVALSGIFIGLQSMLFAVIAMYVSAQMVNYVLTGFGNNLAKTVFVISDFHTAEISRRVIQELHHSGTVIEGTGMYTARERAILMVVVPNNQLNALTRIINEEDPNAFVCVNDAYRVLGRGFRNLNKAIEEE